ncbi:DDE-type integrase/transposase/recombinase [Brevibacterium yomogidense]|uniref:DDE-type integrase/transposase/recombinase n=1 Tax=Brevibacterium yomogidense TaxID=946573 RepID=UPI0038CC1B17
MRNGSRIITYVSTWSRFVCVAFVMDLYSRAIVGWSVDTFLRTNLALNALEHAMRERGRRDQSARGVIHYSDKGSHYTSIAYAKRLVEAGIESPVGSTGLIR